MSVSHPHPDPTQLVKSVTTEHRALWSPKWPVVLS